MNTKKTVYVFDCENNLIATFDKQTECAKHFNITTSHLSDVIKKKCFVKRKYYFSNDKDFKAPIKHSNYNPVFRGLLPTGITSDYYK